jgi:cellulose synthase/poly-beta-1,6-N-acetylglucosamine synthase-like glycosyltransferase
MIWIVVAVMVMVGALELASIVMFHFNFKSFEVESDESNLPFVSVLVAARNEQANLEKCLTALSQLNYPREKLEVLIGDDASVDSTSDIIKIFCNREEKFSAVEIESSYQNLVAKSKVLAQMVNVAKGEYIAFIDADMAATPDWLLNMTAPLKGGYSIVSGYSKVIASKPFEKFQYYDWLNALHFLKSLSDTLKPATTLGNNMIVSLSDYLEVGGFEAIGPNLVEDLALLKSMQKKGKKAMQIVAEEGRAETLAVSSYKFWISQRKRWIKGALNGPLYEQLFLIVQRLMIPLGIMITFVLPNVGFLLIGMKVLIEIFKSFQMHDKTNWKKIDFFLIISPLINSVMDTFALLGLLFNSSVKWKERNY